jgi:lipopolysaccharide biosynthesis glycosyltransferase
MRALVFSIDDAYVMPFKVLWHSLMQTASVPEKTPVYILHTETLSEHSIYDLGSFLGKYKYSASFMDAQCSVPDELPLSHHVSKATYYRLYLGSILPTEVTSAVYLDSDAVVLRSIRQLFELLLTSPLAAVDHMAPAEAFRLWGDLSGQYFQAGVLVIDLAKWREENYEARFAQILANKRDRILWWDQDVLNITFENDWQRLPVWYNVCRQLRYVLGTIATPDRTRFLHLDGGAKPWIVSQKHWTGDAWYRAYEATFSSRFERNKIETPLKNKIFSKIMGPFRRAFSAYSRLK